MNLQSGMQQDGLMRGDTRVTRAMRCEPTAFWVRLVLIVLEECWSWGVLKDF
jgi:hypothetical protein